MTRVLLACPEPLGHGQPAGIGIRFLEIAKVLIADGHQVTLLNAGGGSAAIEGVTFGDTSPESIARATEQSDAVVVQGHIANELFAHGKPLPTVVDLYDPFIVENLHYFATRGAEVFNHDHTTVLNSLARGDFFLCASSAQRLFYLGMLLAIGRLSPVAFESDPHLDSMIAIAPFGVHPPRTSHRMATRHLLFGGIYDWYDPILAIDAVAIARVTMPGLTITFTTHPNPELTPQGKLAEALEHVKKKGYAEFVKFEPWVDYDKRGEFFDRFTAALLTFPQSVETDLSMRTRVYDYLWGGLPIITSSAPGTDELLEQYDAGVVVTDNSPSSFAMEINAAMRVGERLEQMRAGTLRFVAEHQWPEALLPLRQFCRSPRVDRNKDAFAVKLHVPERPASMLDRLKRRIGGAF
jgi:glycosyltransferase involved in cell wall biosynthesis